jgi:hypothetical protein
MSGILTGKVVGVETVTPDSGPVVQTEVATCCHCQQIFEMVKGSGRKRGFCLKCMKLTCGRACCDPCLPLERMIANMEAGRPEDWAPTWASVPEKPKGL